MVWLARPTPRIRRGELQGDGLSGGTTRATLRRRWGRSAWTCTRRSPADSVTGRAGEWPPPAAIPMGTTAPNDLRRSVAAVRPSATIAPSSGTTGRRERGRRPLTNAEWQMAAAGTPDGGTASCNTSGGDVMLTVPGVAQHRLVRRMRLQPRRERHGGKSLPAGVADWVPLSTECPGWATVGGFSANLMCLAGASTTKGPGALVRGGSFEIQGRRLACRSLRRPRRP